MYRRRQTLWWHEVGALPALQPNADALLADSETDPILKQVPDMGRLASDAA